LPPLIHICVVSILYNGLSHAAKSVPSPGGSTRNTRFLRSTQVCPPNGISIGVSVFAQLTHVPNTHTDHATYNMRTKGMQHSRPECGRYGPKIISSAVLSAGYILSFCRIIMHSAHYHVVLSSNN